LTSPRTNHIIRFRQFEPDVTLSRRLSIEFTIALTLLTVAACTKRPEPISTKSEPARLPMTDSNSNGLPDAMELRSFEDRQSFRRWFTAIAEMQFYGPSSEWNPSQRDCAGLVRFAVREALRRHDRAWFQRMGPAYETIAADVRAYTLETSPLGEKIFRTREGGFNKSDLDDRTFSEFADARTLKNYNCVFVGRNRDLARPGDLLFFYQPWVQKFPYHLMIFIGQPRQASEGRADWVVYHTGSSPEDEGTIKKVRLATLDHHPDKRWRPIDANPNYLGFFRLKILGDE